MKVIYVFIFFIISCDFAKDPISNVFHLTKHLTVINETIDIDPSRSNESHFIHTLLFQSLGDLAVISTTDSIEWTIDLNTVKFSVASQDLVEAEDVYFSLKKNLSLLNFSTQNAFNSVFDSYQKINDRVVHFKFKSKFNFKALANSDKFYIYSKNYSTLDIPIGTGSYSVILQPKEDEYVLIPFTPFIHTITDSIDKVYWLNTTKESILKRKFNFDLPEPSRIKDMRDYATR